MVTTQSQLDSASAVAPPLPPAPTDSQGEPLRVFVAARTDIGRRRSVNEDAVFVLSGDQDDLPETDLVFVVADGMGGMAFGDVASREAVRVVRETLVQALAAPGANPQTVLADALVAANDSVNALSRDRNAQTAAAAAASSGDEDTAANTEGGEKNASSSGGVMGTTCVVGVLQADTLHLAHVGDSRAYLFRNARLERLTADHSFVEERVRAGDMSEDEARRSRFRNMITRAVGIEATIQPELRQESLTPGDTLLVCTDGLTTMLGDDEIETALGKSAFGRPRANDGALMDVDAASRTLIDLANKRGGSDNISVVLVHVPEAASEPVRSSGGVGAANGANGFAMAPARDAGRANKPAAPRRGRAAPLVVLLALVGALTLLLAATLAALPRLRAQVGELIGRGASAGAGSAAPGKSRGSTKTGAAAAAAPVAMADLAGLVYGRPQTFVRVLARGDLLTFSPRGYLYFVKDTSGKLVGARTPTGDVLKNAAASLPIAPPSPTPIPVTRNFVASDRQGNVYVSLTLQRKIEKYSPQGQRLATIKGFNRPEAVAVDNDGNVYVVDYNEIKIVRAARPRLFGTPTPTSSPVATKPAKPASTTGGGR